MIISFALTASEFLNGGKTETRRDWKDRTLRVWQCAWDHGHHVHQASDKAIYRGGKIIGRLLLTARPERQSLFFMTPTDLKAEGGMCRTVVEFCHLVKQSPVKPMTVIKFQKL